MSPERWRSFTIEDALRVRDFTIHSPIRFSRDGRWLAYVLDYRDQEELCEQLWITEVGTGRAEQLLPEALRAWAPRWSPVASALAFYASVDGELHLWMWDAETGEARRVWRELVAAAEWHEVSQWLPDGSGVVCKLANATWLSVHHPSGVQIAVSGTSSHIPPGRATVQHWESALSPDDGGAPEVQRTGADLTWTREGETAGTLACVDIASGRATPLAEVTTTQWAVSPDGQRVAFMDYRGETAGHRFDLCVVPCRGGEVTVLAEGLVTWLHGPALSWSPDSSMIAYRVSGAVSVAFPDSGETRRLLGVGDGSYMPDSFAPPLWSPDGAFLLVAQEDTVWRVPVAEGEPADLMPNRGDIRALDAILTPGGRTEMWSPEGASLLVPAVDLAQSARVLVKVGLSGEGILAQSCDLQDTSGTPWLTVDVSPATGRISFLREDATHPPDVWCTDLSFSAPQRLTAISPHVAEVSFGASRLLEWTSPEGDMCRSAFLLPPAHFGPPPYPMVFCVYEGRHSQAADHFGASNWRPHNLQILATRGYAVCLPDLPVSDEHPAQSIRVALACAVQAAVDAGLANPERLGIFGHSYGGYVVHVAIAGLDCFAAAVSSAAWCNLTSAFGAGRDGGEYEAYIVEHGQGRMGVPPWENPLRYLENSPLFALDRVTTPLLILQGTEDAALAQAWEMFNGLRRLSKPAALAIYEGDYHCMERRANIIDWWQRVLAWFDRWLCPVRAGP